MLVSRLRAEDPREWPAAVLAESGALLRIHPGWTEEPGTGAGPHAAWAFRTGIPGGHLRVEVLPATGRDAASRLASVVSSEPARLDALEPERFEAGPHPGVRAGSAGTEPDGTRGWFEYHLVEGPAASILLAYRCPVLSGSREGLALVRCAESVRFPAPGAVPIRETSRALPR